VENATLPVCKILVNATAAGSSTRMCRSFRERHGARAYGKHGIRNSEFGTGTGHIKIGDVFRVLRTIIGEDVINCNRVILSIMF